MSTINDKKEGLPLIETLFFEEPELERQKKDTPPTESLKVMARNIVKFFLAGKYHDKDALKETVFDPRLFKGVASKKNPEFMYLLRHEIHQSLKHLHKQAKDLNIVDKITREGYEKRIQLNIANALSLYVMFEPTPFDENLQVPRFINGKLELVEYKLDPIELPPKKGLGVSVVEDADRVFAYGLTPNNDTNTNRIVIFTGTTFDTGQGEKVQSKINMHPFSSVGEMYHWDNVNKWLDNGNNGLGVDTCGASQGGSLSLLLALMHPDKVNRVDAMNPPGMLEDYDENHPMFGAWEKQKKEDPSKLPNVNVQCQKRDPVSSVGLWKDDWRILKVSIPEKQLIPVPGVNMHYSHIGNYAGQPGAMIREMTGKEDNTKSRRRKTKWVLKGYRKAKHYIGKAMSVMTSPITLLKNIASWILGNRPKEADTSLPPTIHTLEYYNDSIRNLGDLGPKTHGDVAVAVAVGTSQLLSSQQSERQRKQSRGAQGEDKEQDSQIEKKDSHFKKK